MNAYYRVSALPPGQTTPPIHLVAGDSLVVTLEYVATETTVVEFAEAELLTPGHRHTLEGVDRATAPEVLP